MTPLRTLGVMLVALFVIAWGETVFFAWHDCRGTFVRAFTPTGWACIEGGR